MPDCEAEFYKVVFQDKVLLDIRDKAVMGLMFSLFRHWQSTLVFFPEGSHRQRSLVGYGSLGHKEFNTTEEI